MNDELKQPKEYDLVLGGNNPPPTDGLVLDGIEGVKKRLASNDIEVKIAALSDAQKYGDEGLDLVVDALQDKSDRVGIAAYKLLRDRKEARVRDAILNFNPYRFFECIHDIKTPHNDPGFIVFTQTKLLYCGSNSSFVSGESIIRYIEWNFSQSKQTHLLELELLSEQYFISNIHSRIASLYIHPETNTLIVAGTPKDNVFCNQIEIIDLATGVSEEELDTIYEEELDTLDNSKIDSVSKKQIIHTLYGHSNGGTVRVNIAMSNDRKLLASSSQRAAKWNQKDNSVILWDLQTGNKIHTLKGHTKKVTSLAISNNNSILATASKDGTIQEWDIKTGENIFCVRNSNNIVTNNCLLNNNGLIQLKTSNSSDLFSINSDGSILAFAKYNRYSQDINKIEIFNTKTDRHLATLNHDKVSGIAISADGNTIATIGANITTTHENNCTLYSTRSNIKIWQIN